MEQGGGRVCVTGAGGFVASWLVKLLLSKGYMIHGTVRNPDDEKNNHLKSLEMAQENLLFKADLLDYDSLYAAIEGCSGVFHVASPVPPSSVANPELWYYNTWYCISKTTAEREALKYAENSGLDVVTVCPSYVFGPLLQSTMNTSSRLLIELFKGRSETIVDRVWPIVDVRDVAEGLLLVYEKKEASGRYICAPHSVQVHSLVEKLKSKYPNHNYPKNYIEVDPEGKLSSDKLKRLGWECRSLEETIADSVEYYQEAGILNKD